jgi:dTDP-4-dehydrorhamnose 3,5-epimerase
VKTHKKLADGLFLIEKKKLADERGFFERIFCPNELREFWGERTVVQVNRSFTRDVGSFRGFHYQKAPFLEMKFVQCTKGKVLDIVIDLREGSETFLQVFSFELSADNNLCVIIPEGFAHGFQVLEENSELIYFHSAPYAKEFEGGINLQDPKIKITLPLPVKEMSLRDQEFKFIDENFKGLKI